MGGHITGVNAQFIREACLAWATRPEGQRWCNGGIHFQLATDQVGDVVQCIRTLLHLRHLTGNVDTPAGNRGPTRAPSLGAEGAGPLGPYWEVTDMMNGCPITTSEKGGGATHHVPLRDHDRPQPLRRLPILFGGVQNREQRAYRQLLDQGAARRPE